MEPWKPAEPWRPHSYAWEGFGTTEEEAYASANRLRRRHLQLFGLLEPDWPSFESALTQARHRFPEFDSYGYDRGWRVEKHERLELVEHDLTDAGSSVRLPSGSSWPAFM